MSQPCPKCGKPTRTGAKFCGFCGQDLSNLPATPPQPPSPAVPASQTPTISTSEAHAGKSVFCPHCGKPVRVGVKYCPSCGKPVPPSSPQSHTPPPEKPPVTKWMLPIAGIITLLLICCMVIGGVWWGKTHNDHETPATPEATAPLENTPAPTNTVTPVQTSTATSAPTATSTATLTPTPTLSPTVPITATPTLTITETITPSTDLIFEDNFDANLDQWRIWEGTPQPEIDPTYHALIIPSNGNAQTGLTTREEPLIPLSNVAIEFKVWIGETEHPLQFMLHPGPQMPAAGQPGWLTLTMEPSKILLQSRDGEELCSTDSSSDIVRIRVEIAADNMVRLFVNNIPADCKRLPPLPEQTGSISFGGAGGQIIYIKVLHLPASQ